MLKDRMNLLSSFADGSTPPKDLIGLSLRDIEALAQLAAAAMVAKRFDQARRVFDALAALDPGEHRHLLHLAYACAGASDVAATRDAVDRLVGLDAQIPADDLARALLLRAEAVAASDRDQAERDMVAVRVLAERSPSARKVMEGAR